MRKKNCPPDCNSLDQVPVPQVNVCVRVLDQSSAWREQIEGCKIKA